MDFLASLHPVVVHFPIVIFVLYCLFEILNIVAEMKFSVTAHILLFLGIVAGILAVLTGNLAADLFVKSSNIDNSAITDLMENHETYATILLWYFLFVLVARTYFVLNKKLTKRIVVVLSIASAFGLIFVYFAGMYGGELVFKYGVGTELIK